MDWSFSVRRGSASGPKNPSFFCALSSSSDKHAVLFRRLLPAWYVCGLCFPPETSLVPFRGIGRCPCTPVILRLSEGSEKSLEGWRCFALLVYSSSCNPLQAGLSRLRWCLRCEESNWFVFPGFTCGGSLSCLLNKACSPCALLKDNRFLGCQCRRQAPARQEGVAVLVTTSAVGLS